LPTDRKALTKLSYGVYIVSAEKDGRPNGQIANTVFQVTSEPVMVAVCINEQNLTHEFIEASGRFSISILSLETPIPFIGRFGFRSGRDIDKFDGVEYKKGETGIPIVLEHSLGYLEAEVVSRIDAVTHTIFIGKVSAGEVIREGEPLTYAAYHEIKKGKTPKAAPTYIKGK